MASQMNYKTLKTTDLVVRHRDGLVARRASHNSAIVFLCCHSRSIIAAVDVRSQLQ